MRACGFDSHNGCHPRRGDGPSLSASRRDRDRAAAGDVVPAAGALKGRDDRCVTAVVSGYQLGGSRRWNLTGFSIGGERIVPWYGERNPIHDFPECAVREIITGLAADAGSHGGRRTRSGVAPSDDESSVSHGTSTDRAAHRRSGRASSRMCGTQRTTRHPTAVLSTGPVAPQPGVNYPLWTWRIWPPAVS